MATTTFAPDIKKTLDRGVVIPAHPLALNASRKLDERRQRALARYYIAAGSGGLAVGVHTTQFEIREPAVGLYEPVLTIAKEEMDRADASRKPEQKLIRIGGAVGRTEQAVREATKLRDLGYHAALLSLAAMKDANDEQLVAHCRAVADVIPLVGFYLQPAVGGRALPFSFWRKFAEIPNVVAIKMAPFNRYQTIDVVRAVAESGRADDIALYTGNDDNIVMDLLTPYRFKVGQAFKNLCIVGGLLGHWSVWTKTAVELLASCHKVVCHDQVPMELLRRNIEVTDSNAAFFDAANAFAGCIAGLHEVLRRQGLLEGTWCLNPNEMFGPGQLAEIDRVYAAYPHLNDDAFVAQHRDEWLR
jgi:dihydrodipicolinate synthase/N-acetylneuraminate lyase